MGWLIGALIISWAVIGFDISWRNRDNTKEFTLAWGLNFILNHIIKIQKDTYDKESLERQVKILTAEKRILMLQKDIAYQFISTQIKDFEKTPLSEDGTHRMIVSRSYLETMKKVLVDSDCVPKDTFEKGEE